MDRWLGYFLQKKLIVYLFTALIVLAGIGSLFTFKVSFVPQTNLPWIVVSISGGALPPEEMEEKVADPVEKELKENADILEITSNSRTGAVQITVKAKEGKGNEVKQQVESTVNRLRSHFPEPVTDVRVYQANYGDEELINFALSGPDPQTMLNLAKTTIKDRLEAVEGVKAVEIQDGQFENKVRLLLKPERLAAFELSPAEVIRQLREADWKQAVGTLENSGFNTVVEIDNSFRTVQEIAETVIDTPRGPVSLREVADVQDERGALGDQYWIHDQKPILYLTVKRTQDSDVIDTQRRVEEAVRQLNEEANGAYKLETVYEVASFIQNSIRNLSKEVIIGGVLAILILMLFLKNWRVTLVIATTLPLSALMTFVAMKVFGYDIDAVSLISLSLSVGLIVDAAIVVLESIYHFRERGEPLGRAIVLGTREVMTPVLSSQITMVVVFLPLVLADFGEEYRPIFTTIAFTVTAAITSSTLAAFFFVPVLSDNFLKRDNTPSASPDGGREALGLRIARWFRRLLTRALQHRVKTVLIAIVLFVSAFFLTPFIKQGEFLNANENWVFARLIFPPGTSIEAAQKRALAAEQEIRKVPETRQVYVQISKESSMIFAQLVPKSERDRDRDALAKDINERLKNVEGVERVEVTFQGTQAPVQLQVKGKDLEVLRKLAGDVETMLASIPGVENVRNDFDRGSEKVTLLPKKDVMERLQVDDRSLAEQIGAFIGEQTVTRMTVDGVEFDVTAKYPDDWMKHPDQLRQLMVTSRTGAQVPLGDLVDWKVSRTPDVLVHDGGERVVTVSAELIGTDVGTVARQIAAKMNELAIPAGYQVKTAGQLQQQTQNLSSGLLVFFGAAALIYIIMVAQFGRLSHPLIILLTLPMAFFGVVIGLVVTQRVFSLMAIVGVTMLIGIVVSNAILLIDRINLLRERGMAVTEAILQGVQDRVRPVLMTKLTAILGMLPMALALSADSDFHAPLATVVIFGLAFHTLITLILVPVLYSLFESYSNWRTARKERRRARRLEKRMKQSGVTAAELPAPE